MSDINFSTPSTASGAPGLQVIDRDREGKGHHGHTVHHERVHHERRGFDPSDAMMVHHAKEAADFARVEINEVGREAVAAVERSGLHLSDRVCDASDRTNDNIFSSSARTADKLCDVSDRTNDNIYNSSARMNDRLAAVSERTNDNLFRGFESTQREIGREFARTNDVMASKFEHQDRFMAQNFKEIQLQQARDAAVIEKEILRAKAEMELQACKDKAALELRMAECCAETQCAIKTRADETETLIRTLDAQKTATALSQANMEILTLKLFSGIPPAAAFSPAK